MNEAFFQQRYPAGYPGTIDADKYNSVIELFDRFVNKFAERPAFRCLDHNLSYGELDRLSADFASYLPEWKAPTVTTPGSWGASSRETSVCNASTICAPSTTGSLV